MRFPLPPEYPVILPELPTAVHVKDVPATPEESAILVVPPEQKDCEGGVKMTLATGNTVTVKLVD